MTTVPEAAEQIIPIAPVPTEPMDTLDYLRMHPATLQLERLGDRLGVIEPLAQTRLGQRAIGLGERTHNVVREMNADIADSDHRVIDGAWRGAMYGSQYLDKIRYAMFVISNAAISASEHSSERAGLVAGGIFALWTGGVGEILIQNANRLPRATRAVQKEFPAAVDLMSDALPGAYKKETDETVIEQETFGEEKVAVNGLGKVKDIAKTIFRGITYPLRKGAVSVNFGSTAYVATTKFNGGSNWEARKQYGKVMAYGGALVTGIAWGITETIEHLVEDGHYDAAQRLYDTVDSDITWYIFAGATIALEASATVARKRKLQKEGKINEIGEAIEQPPLAE